jgi:hypothetical protein
MINTLLFILVLLQIKHWCIDFVYQTDEELEYKGDYMEWLGITHSLKHGIGTFVCLWIVTGWPNVEFAFFIGTLDFILHYHIDWIKKNYGNGEIHTKEFWNHLGLDQMAHQLCYIAFAGLTIL